MFSRRFLTWVHRLHLCALSWLFLPALGQASFIETSSGTAVLNDATAAYYNPAALVLLKNSQFITQGSITYFNTQFNGSSTLAATGFTQSGNSSSSSHYYSPSFYLGVPTTDKIIFGLALVSNSGYRDTEGNSVLRYVQASNNVEDCDLVPSIAVKINDFISLGGGINFSYANFNLRPIIGFPGSNVPDSVSHNQSDGTGIGGNIGFLLKPNPRTLVGFNYRSSTSYILRGKSVFESNPPIISNNYHFKLWTPARSVLSISQWVTPKLGFIATVQRIQWSVLNTTNIYGIATKVGTQPLIVNGHFPQYLHDAWLVTLGSNYRISPKWMFRVAGTYNQSPGNPYYQIANGDSIILGASTSYDINKIVSIDGSYAHAFLEDENIMINRGRYLINGVNEGSRDGVSVKLTFNL